VTSSHLKLPTAVIWDMDGTLIDQTGPILRCYAEIIQSFGHPAPEAAAIQRSMGGPMAETMALFVRPEEMEMACRNFRQRFPEMMYEGLIILPGALELISEFSRRRIPQCILTNKHGDTARAVSKHCGFSEAIKVCIGNTDTEWSKPHAALTHYALERLGAAASGAILIGDSPTDIATASEAGLDCYGVATGAHSSQELAAAGAVAAFDSLEALQQALLSGSGKTA